MSKELVINTIVKLIQQLKSENIFEDFEECEFTEEIQSALIEWQLLISNSSSAEQEKFLNETRERLNLAAQSVDLTELKKIKMLLLQFNKEEQKVTSNSSLNMESTSTSSMTAYSPMAAADVGSLLLPEDVRQKFYAESLEKKTGELCSSITYSVEPKGKSYTVKSVVPIIQPNFLIDLKVYDLTKVDLLSINPNDLWRHATQKIKFYGLLNNPHHRQVFTQIQTMSKSIQSCLEMKLEKKKGPENEDLMPKPKKLKKSTPN